MKKLLVFLFLLIIVSSVCFAAITEEEMNSLYKLIMSKDNWSGIAIINSNIKTNADSNSSKKFDLVIIGPDCHVLPGWYFQSCTIGTLIILSEDLQSGDTLPIFPSSTKVDNKFANVPYFFVEDAVKRALQIK